MFVQFLICPEYGFFFLVNDNNKGGGLKNKTSKDKKKVVIKMAKQGMKRPGSDETGNKRPKNTVPPVPEIQGKAKSGKKTAGNNQWTNNQLKFDNRDRRDGPGGE